MSGGSTKPVEGPADLSSLEPKASLAESHDASVKETSDEADRSPEQRALAGAASRPEQAVLNRDTDMCKTDETRAVIEGMVNGLNDHRIDDTGQFFADSFRRMDNRGCGNKIGLREFQDNWQCPFQAAFSDKVCVVEARLYMGEWAAVCGWQEATYLGQIMEIAPTGKRVGIRYMEFWKVENGRITDTWMMVDSPNVMAQLGVDVFEGEG